MEALLIKEADRSTGKKREANLASLAATPIKDVLVQGVVVMPPPADVKQFVGRRPVGQLRTKPAGSLISNREDATSPAAAKQSANNKKRKAKKEVLVQ